MRPRRTQDRPIRILLGEDIVGLPFVWRKGDGGSGDFDLELGQITFVGPVEGEVDAADLGVDLTLKGFVGLF
jgi:hypothetical protein